MESHTEGEDKGGKERTSMRGGAEAGRFGGSRGDVGCCDSEEDFLEIGELLESGKRRCNARGNVVLENKSLRHHNLFVDVNGLMRIGSCLVNADIDDEAKFPAILPPKDEHV